MSNISIYPIVICSDVEVPCNEYSSHDELANTDTNANTKTNTKTNTKSQKVYLVVNSTCECAALVINRHLMIDDIERVIDKVTQFHVELEWILLVEKPEHPEVVCALQKLSGGVIAGDKTALSVIAHSASLDACQFEELSDHQVFLLGHIECLVLATNNKRQLGFLIENNLFASEHMTVLDGKPNSRLLKANSYMFS